MSVFKHFVNQFSGQLGEFGLHGFADPYRNDTESEGWTRNVINLDSPLSGATQRSAIDDEGMLRGTLQVMKKRDQACRGHVARQLEGALWSRQAPWRY